MRSKNEFVEHWKRHIAGGFLYGYDADTRLGPAEAARKLFNIPQDVEGLLGRMWDWLQAGQPSQNGKPAEKTHV